MVLLNERLMKRDKMQKVDREQVGDKLVKAFWDFGLMIWSQRNNMEHGTSHSVSIVEREMIHEEVKSAYEKLKPMVGKCDKWLFKKWLKQKVTNKYDMKVAWMGLLKKMYKYYEYEWYKRESRTAVHVEYVEENIHSSSLRSW